MLEHGDYQVLSSPLLHSLSACSSKGISSPKYVVPKPKVAGPTILCKHIGKHVYAPQGS
jgi:hypothetical protein